MCAMAEPLGAHTPVPPLTSGVMTSADAVAVLDAMFAGSSMGLAVWDRELRFRLINQALADINGPPPEAHIGRTVEEVLGPLGAAEAEVFRSVMTSGTPVLDHEVTGETPSAPGVQRRWRASYYPIRDGQRILGIAGTVVETTNVERARQSEQRATRLARAAGALLDAVFAAAPIGLAVWSPDMRFQRVNDALAAMNGVPIEAHIGRRIDDVLGHHAPKIRADLERTIASREPLLDVRSAVGGAEGVRHFETSYYPVLDGDDEVTAVGAVVREVTDSLSAERERVRLLKEALEARAKAEAAQVRAESARIEAEDARRRTEFLAEASRRMADSRDVESTLQQVAAAAVEAVADWCSITLVESDGSLRTLAVAHRDPAKTRWARELVERYPPARDAPAGAPKVIRTGEVEHIPEIPPELVDAVAVDDEQRRILHELGLRSSLVVPLRTEPGVIGALSLIFAESGRTFTTDDVSLARSLAARAALHIQNARLVAELADIASALQRSLLPRRLPIVPGLDIATRYEPVGEHNEVGGDFYDLFSSRPGVWTAIMGDVSGKGAEAAALTALARHTLRAGAMREANPAANLRLLNEAMLADAASSRFCTVSYARLTPGPDGLDIKLANGGHMPPLIARGDGTLEQIELPGSLVGVLPDAVFDCMDLRLAPGDTLLLYTDGVTDLRTRDAASGEARLAETVVAAAPNGVEALVDAVRAMATEAQGGRPRDDMALMAIRPR